MDALPSVIIELGAALSGPDYNRVRVIAAFDALGVLFLSNPGHALDSVEGSWLVHRGPGLAKSANDVIGADWHTAVPWAAAILDSAIGYGGGHQPRVWGVAGS